MPLWELGVRSWHGNVQCYPHLNPFGNLGQEPALKPTHLEIFTRRKSPFHRQLQRLSRTGQIDYNRLLANRIQLQASGHCKQLNWVDPDLLQSLLKFLSVVLVTLQRSISQASGTDSLCEICPDSPTAIHLILQSVLPSPVPSVPLPGFL